MPAKKKSIATRITETVSEALDHVMHSEQHSEDNSTPLDLELQNQDVSQNDESFDTINELPKFSKFKKGSN